MSALAARRAALAAKAAIAAEAPSPTPTPPPPKSKSATRPKRATKPAPPTPPSPTLSEWSGVSDDDYSEDSAGPSSKRRRVAKKPKPQEKDKEARYFAGVEITTRASELNAKPKTKPRKQRAFSPSAAVEELDDVSGESSGAEEDMEPMQPEDSAPWSGAPSPWEPRPPP